MALRLRPAATAWADVGINASKAAPRLSPDQRSATYGSDGSIVTDPSSDLPVWPYGLAFNVLLGAAALAITATRLRTPTQKLPRATRIA